MFASCCIRCICSLFLENLLHLALFLEHALHFLLLPKLLLILRLHFLPLKAALRPSPSFIRLRETRFSSSLQFSSSFHCPFHCPRLCRVAVFLIQTNVSLSVIPALEGAEPRWRDRPLTGKWSCLPHIG